MFMNDLSCFITLYFEIYYTWKKEICTKICVKIIYVNILNFTCINKPSKVYLAISGDMLTQV